MAKQTLTIMQGGASILSLHTGFGNWAEAEMALMELTGFDDINNINIETVPKLFGTGSYIVSKTIMERPISIRGALFTEDARSIRDAIEAAANSLEPVTLSLKRGNTNNRMEAYIVSLTWTMYSENEAEFSMELTAVNPTKVVGPA